MPVPPDEVCLTVVVNEGRRINVAKAMRHQRFAERIFEKKVKPATPMAMPPLFLFSGDIVIKFAVAFDDVSGPAFSSPS